MLTVQDVEQLAYYSTRLSRLRVDRAHGIAPHKPILVLSVIHLIRNGEIDKNRIDLSKQLNEAFLFAWNYLGSDTHNPDISRPFFHLRGDKFWHLIPRAGFQKILNSKIKLKTFCEVQKAVKYAYIDDRLFQFLQNEPIRDSLETVLVKKWFAHKQDEYEQLCCDRLIQTKQTRLVNSGKI